MMKKMALGIYSLFIGIGCLIVTAYFIIDAFIKARVTHFPRPEVDRRLRQWGRSLMRMVDAKITVQYETPIHWEENRGYIYISNHSSVFDIPLAFDTLPGTIRMVAKKELIKIPFFGKSVVEQDFILIDRKDREAAIQMLEVAKEKMRSGVRLWAAPEGTRAHSKKLQTFKQGIFYLAIETGATIIPVGVEGTQEILASHHYFIERHQPVTVRIGAPIDASAYPIEKRQDLVNRVRQEVARLAHLEME